MSAFKEKKVLVTGATGLIGSHLVDELLREGAVVIACGRSEKKLKTVFANNIGNSSFLYVSDDISVDFPNVGDDIDYIFHAASPISGMEIKTKPVDTIRANINGSINCLEHLKKQGHGKMILFSSATVYGNQLDEEKTVTEEETTEADPLHTSNAPYSESKRMIEVLARAYLTQYEVDSVIVRIGYAYGYSLLKPSTAFYEFIAKAVNGENIVLNNSGMGRRDNIYVDDVVNGLLLVAEKGARGESYNLSSNGDEGNFKAIDEMAQMIAAAVNSHAQQKVKVVFNKFCEKRNPGLKLDNTKIKKLGWSIKTDLEHGITETVEKYLEQQEII